MFHTSMIFEVIFISCSVASILFIWLHTEAFTEYAKLFGGEKFFEIDKFEKAREKEPMVDYPYYLISTNPSFFIKLITCPFCLAVWTVLGICLLRDAVILAPICYVTGLIVYKYLYKVLYSN